MYFVIAGGGEVGFHLAKALLESSHEVMLLESDRRRAQVIEEKLGSVVLNAPADEGRYQLEAGCQRADAVIAVTGEDPANLIICQLAKWKCNVPRVIARVNDPKNEIVFKALGIDETISSTRVIMNVIEQELPSGGFLPLMPLTGSHLELIEAEIAAGTPSAGKSIGSLGLPDGAAIGGIVRKGAVVPSVTGQVVRHVDDDRVRPEEQADLQPQSGLVVQHVFPDVMRDELREHDRDRTFVILARSCIDVREQPRDERAIRRFDHDQRDAVVARAPACPH